MVITKLLMVIALVFPTVSIAAYVDSSNREWRDLVETINFSWDQINALPTDGSGALVGSIDSTDFTGWTWATIEAVDALFAELTPNPSNIITNYYEENSSWAPAALTALGGATSTTHANDSVVGWAATVAPGFYKGYAPHIDDYMDPLDTDISVETYGLDRWYSGDWVGVYLYREASPVPVPAAVWLFGSGLLGLIGYSKHKKLA